ncbi:methyltransferase [Streptomyces sp. NPDC005322]|uniref:methyltransferase n=1 Tax=Streptomyces sp. NPDC005322 TaxID=3157032 RepID=UPI0033B576E1
MTDVETERRRLSEIFDVAPSRVLYALCALGVPDHVPAEGATLGELAMALGVEPARLARLIRAAETLDVVRIDPSQTVCLTDAGMLLRSDHPVSLSAEFADNELFMGWGSFAQSVTGEGVSYELIYNKSIFEKIGDDSQALKIFHEHMRMRAMEVYRPLLPYLLKRCSADIVDLAGGTGGLAELLLDSRDGLRVTLVDLPEVVALISDDTRARYGERLVCVPGDIRSAVPEGFGTYVLGSVLHDWPDGRAVDILRQCARGARSGGEVILLERVLDETGPDRRRLGDMWMMAMTGGRERTRADWVHVALEAGLSLLEIHHVDGELSAVVLGMPS